MKQRKKTQMKSCGRPNIMKDNKKTYKQTTWDEAVKEGINLMLIVVVILFGIPMFCLWYFA